MDRQQLKAQAKEQIKGKIGVLIAVTLVIGAMSTIRIYLMVVRGGTPEVKNCFDGFDDFFSAFKVTFLVGIYTFLWSLLFIIPGIVKGYSYSMALYVLADNKGKSARECIEESKAMMEGHKMELFVLDLSFIGWYLLCSLTCGLAFLYVAPLLNATHANVYETIKPVMEVPFELIENTEE